MCWVKGWNHSRTMWWWQATIEKDRLLWPWLDFGFSGDSNSSRSRKATWPNVQFSQASKLWWAPKEVVKGWQRSTLATWCNLLYLVCHAWSARKKLVCMFFLSSWRFAWCTEDFSTCTGRPRTANPGNVLSDWWSRNAGVIEKIAIANSAALQWWIVSWGCCTFFGQWHALCKMHLIHGLKQHACDIPVWITPPHPSSWTFGWQMFLVITLTGDIWNGLNHPRSTMWLVGLPASNGNGVCSINKSIRSAWLLWLALGMQGFIASCSAVLTIGGLLERQLG